MVRVARVQWWRMTRLTKWQALALGAVLLLCVSVPVGLAVAHGRGGEQPALNAVGTPKATVSGAVQMAAGQPDVTPSASGDASAVGGDATASPSATATPAPTATPEIDPSNTIIRQGVTAPVVAEIQKRLMELDYMGEDEPTEYYGSVTGSAIALFQRQHKLSVDGAVGMETYTLLMGDEAQKYTVMEGASGEDVKDLQDRLYELGYLEKVTGNFGQLTAKAVQSFQEYNGLTTDGKVGQKTRELLYSADAKAYFLKYGEQSSEVKTYQNRLKTLGYLMAEADGKYGTNTVTAVQRFQEINGLIADGFLGPQTVKLLMSGSAHANALILGMSGSDIENVQKKLKALGYMKSVTGYFGSATEDAVKAFQKRNGLSSDGTVGKKTLSVLSSGSAKKAGSDSGGGSGGGGGDDDDDDNDSGGSSNLKGVERLISIAESKLGCKYVWGAKGPNKFDCSGFVYYCLNKAGVKQGYLTSKGWASSRRFQKITSTSKLKRGDILVFSGDSAGHVGIYLGNGRMIDASSSNGKVVKRSGLWSGSYWSSHFICAFRVY